MKAFETKKLEAQMKVGAGHVVSRQASQRSSSVGLESVSKVFTILGVPNLADRVGPRSARYAQGADKELRLGLNP